MSIFQADPFYRVIGQCFGSVIGSGLRKQGAIYMLIDEQQLCLLYNLRQLLLKNKKKIKLKITHHAVIETQFQADN